jgi:hypothetical protein
MPSFASCIWSWIWIWLDLRRDNGSADRQPVIEKNGRKEAKGKKLKTIEKCS